MFRKIDKTSTFNDVLKQIIEKIQTGELKPGDALPAERILAEEFGISRPALREVLKALSLLGITVSGRYISWYCSILVKVRKPAITPVPREINRLINKGFFFIKELPLFLKLIYYILLSWQTFYFWLRY